MGGKATYVIEHGLHESNGDLGLLHEVILRILDFKTSMLLFGGCGVLQAIKAQVVSINMSGGREFTYVCLAASNSKRLTRTACLAFMATVMLVAKVVCHGAKKLF